MAEPLFINPFTDFGFKKIFGEEQNKDLLIDSLKYYNDLKNSLDTAQEEGYQEGYQEAQAIYEAKLEQEKQRAEQEKQRAEQELQLKEDALLSLENERKNFVQSVLKMHEMGLTSLQIAQITNRSVTEIEVILTEAGV